MYYYKMSDGTVIDVEKICLILDRSQASNYKVIKFDSNYGLEVKVKEYHYGDLSPVPDYEPGIKDIEAIENIMKELTMKNVARVRILDSNIDKEKL